MLKRLELQALRADLAAVNSLLAERTQESDPIGFFQLSRRRDTLTAKMDKVAAVDSHRAAVGLFFAGGPVIGSLGIDATFAAKTVTLFQEMVTKQFALEEVGDMGRRGPVAMQANSDLIVTNVVRGSVGLLLEEAAQTDAFADTQLKVVVDRVVETVSAAAAPEGDAFEQALERMDPRFLSSLGQFFEVLDEKKALVRVVEEDREVELSRDAVRRGKERAGAATIEDSDPIDMTGRIFILPAARRFELWLIDGDAPLVGAVAREFARRDLETLLAAGNAVGERWKVRVKTRTVRRPARAPKVSHTLVGMVERIDN
ncbi:hypothetical protein CHL79_11825 [Delftia acidovorans]|uniref:hypothetical protein n=1 Tax=Delftia acidovorans TaxID=80866 RepID=UPI000BC30611|nr:hypothetical protein [Delftia acidovorans]ATH13054.1 hypothetical protein CHL79_11825 [Delftia acidovorans]